MKIKRLNIGSYTLALYKRQPAPTPDDGPTRAEVIAGERPPHWIIRLTRGRYKWDFKNFQSVIPPTNKQALAWGEEVCLREARSDGQYSETAIYMLAGMQPQGDN